MRKKVGEILVEHGYITQEQLQEALDIQSRPEEHRLIGQILISRGWLTPVQIKVALALQAEESGEDNSDHGR